MTDEMTENQREFQLQKIYVKDLSFETPNSPAIFSETWKPSYNLNLNSDVKALQGDQFEVILSATVTCKLGEKIAFLVEVQQAGIFLVKGYQPQEMGPMMGAYCPNLLFPYLRETVSDIVTRGSFPQLLLTPVNFEALYAQQLKQQAEKEKQEGEQTEH